MVSKLKHTSEDSVFLFCHQRPKVEVVKVVEAVTVVELGRCCSCCRLSPVLQNIKWLKPKRGNGSCDCGMDEVVRCKGDI